MDILQRHMPESGQNGVDELLMIAWRYEEKIFQAVTDQVLYINSRSLKLQKLSLQIRSCITVGFKCSLSLVYPNSTANLE